MPNSNDAVSFCLLGAIRKCYHPSEEIEIKDKIRTELKLWNIAVWNDNPKRTHQEVLKLVTKLDI